MAYGAYNSLPNPETLLKHKHSDDAHLSFSTHLHMNHIYVDNRMLLLNIYIYTSLYLPLVGKE